MMKRATALLVGILAVGTVGLAVHGVAVGLSAGYEISGLFLVGALTEMAVNPLFDLRAQIGFATSDVSGLMLVSADLLAGWPVPPVEPYLGLGVGAALTPPPFSTGFVIEALIGVRAALSELVGGFIQARYLVRWSDAGWTAGPVFEGGLLVAF